MPVFSLFLAGCLSYQLRSEDPVDTDVSATQPEADTDTDTDTDTDSDADSDSDSDADSDADADADSDADSDADADSDTDADSGLPFPFDSGLPFDSGWPFDSGFPFPGDSGDTDSGCFQTLAPFEPGMLDCDGVCAPVSWATDDVCDDGAYGADFNCAAFAFDDGQCADTGSP